MFSIEELEALVVGAGWVRRQTDDSRLSAAAANLMSKISAVLPPQLRDELDSATLWVNARRALPSSIDPGMLRDAIRKEQKLRIGYRDEAGNETERVIWPFMIGFFEERKVVGAWCELRNDFRSFRIDRIANAAATGERLPRRRAVLLKEWRLTMNIPAAAGN
jgi:predicted DNA-binding transcriptional regulator YafY